MGSNSQNQATGPTGNGMQINLYERFNTNEVLRVQEAWAQAVIDQDAEALLGLYDFDREGGPILFKPTLSMDIRTDRPGTESYFIGGDPRYAYDKGFLNHGWVSVRFESAAGPVFEAGGRACVDMGQYVFETPDGEFVRADYTFSYHKPNGAILITLHHSSLVWAPDPGEH
jgi:hypothetical protein